MQSIHRNINRYMHNKTVAFLRRSFIFALFSATFLYMAVRVFFYDFPFTIGEGFELHTGMLLTIWIFIIGCKLVFTSIVLLENSLIEMKALQIGYVQIFKRLALIVIAAVLAYAGKTQRVVIDTKIPDSCGNSKEDQAKDIDNNFLIKLPS